MADTVFEEICDSATGQCVLIDPLTGSPATLTDPATGQVVTAAPYFNPSSRSPDVAPQIRAEYPAGATFVPPDTRVAVTPSGQARPDLTAALPAPIAEQATVGAAPPGYDGGSYSGGGSGYGYPSAYGGRGSFYDKPQMPAYANGQMHPAFGGKPLQAGGFWAQQGGGYDDRQQVTSTSGATAGPFAVRAARPPKSGMSGQYGGGDYGDGGGGGGGIARDMYWQMANKIKSMVMGGGQSSGYQAYPEYKPTKYPKPYVGPDDPRTQRKVERIDEKFASKASTYAHPEFAIPGSVNLESPLGLRMMQLPGADLALLAGAGTKKWSGGIDPTEDIYDDYYERLNKKLKAGRQGIDFLPFYRKAIHKDDSTQQFNAMLQGIYNSVAQGKRINTGALFGNLINPAKDTYIYEQFKNAPPGEAADQFLGSYNALLASGDYGSIQRNALAKLGQMAVTKYGQQYSGGPPRKIPTLNAWVGGMLGSYFQR